LKGNLRWYTDVDLNSDSFNNYALWVEGLRGFRPWYWPMLPFYLECFQRKIKDVMSNLNEPIHSVLGIPDEIVELMPKSVIEFIGDDPLQVTFKDFVEKSGNGLNVKDKRAIDEDEILGRIAAARISKWLEWSVLQGQDILVDAPHLVSRYPSLLQGDLSNVNIWNRTATFEKFEQLGLKHEVIEDFRFKRDYWLSRPAWFWKKVSNDNRITEIAEPWKREITSYVFCEDSSCFYEREKCKEFKAELESPYDRRFILKFEDVDYEPKVRLYH